MASGSTWRRCCRATSRGCPLQRPPVLWDIESDPVLAGTKLIAEAWDAAGLYQVGQLRRRRLAGVERKFRDDVRRFVKSDNDTVVALRLPLLRQPGSLRPRGAGARAERQLRHVARRLHPERPGQLQRQAQRGERRGQPRRVRREPELELRGRRARRPIPTSSALRQRQVKNFLAITLLSLGTPMLLMGDEVRRTQRGNNNAYCQDNEISWFDWTLLERHRDLHRFVKTLVRQRRELGDEFGRTRISLNELLREADIQPHGITLNRPGSAPRLAQPRGHRPRHARAAATLHAMFNAYWEPLTFELPRDVVATVDRHVPRGARRRERRRRAARSRARPTRCRPRSLVVLVAVDGDGALAHRLSGPAERRRRVPVTTPHIRPFASRGPRWVARGTGLAQPQHRDGDLGRRRR